MRLADYRPRTDTVNFPGVEDGLVVRGLSVADLGPMLARRSVLIEELVGMYQTMQTDVFTQRSLSVFISRMIMTAPELVAEVISAAAGEPEAVEVAASLPLNLQAEALEKIASLTFDEMGGLKNLSAVLASQIKTMMTTPNVVTLPPQKKMIPLR